MHSRRSQSDVKSTSSMSSSLLSISTTNNATLASTMGRVSIYSMRERVILNKMTSIIGKIAPDTETEVTSRLHQEVPAIRVDGHLGYCSYIAFQDFVHLNVIYMLLYHAVFWLDPNIMKHDSVVAMKMLESTQDEETHLIISPITFYYPITSRAINTDLINKYVYFSLVVTSLIELVCTFLCTLRKKLPYVLQRHQNLKNRINRFLTSTIVTIYIGFVTWLLLHTFVTHQLTPMFSFIIIGHLIILTLLDKFHLFQKSPNDLTQSPPPSPPPSLSSSAALLAISKLSQRSSTSSSSASSTTPASLAARLSYRSSTSTASKKIQLPLNSFTSPKIIPWSRWSSITDEKIKMHECSTIYAQARQEADDLWPIVVRRILLNVYRTLASFVLYDLIPIKTMETHVRSIDHEPIKFLITIFVLSSLVTHYSFLFPVKFQTTLHRIATHLGQWRQQSNIRTDTINEWSSECNSYTRGSVVKLPPDNRYYIAIQHLNNAANPQSKSHSILYRLFGDPTYLLTIQFILCIILIVFHIAWVLRSRLWQHSLIGYWLIFYSSYPIFKTVRDRIIIDLAEEHESCQASTISKQNHQTEKK